MRLLSKLCSLTFFVCLTFKAFSQVAIGTGANAPNPDTNAVLLLEGNGSQGIIIPKVSSLGTFGKPGMIVYNTSTGTVHYFNTAWVQVGSGGSGTQGIQISGNKVLIGTGAGFLTEFSIANTAPGANGQILMWDSSLNAGAGGWTSSAANAPSAVGQVLKWNGSRWEPGTDNGGSTTTLSGDVSGPSNNSTISLTAGNSIAAALNNAATTSKILPAQISAGTAGQVLTTTGGVAVWSAPTGGALPSLSANQLLSNNGNNTGINVGGDIGLSVTGTTGTFTIANNAITDSKVATGISAGKITTGTLPVAQVPNLDASKINTGTFTVAQIPSLDATKITSGTFATSQIPNLDAAKITIGTLSSARLDVGTTANKIVQLDATGKLPALDGSQLTNLPAGAETDPTVKAISGIIKSNGTTISAATAGTDYQLPLVSGTNIKTINGTSVLGAGNITAVTTETDPTVKAINGLVKSNGTTISAAAAGTDYAPATTGSSILKGNGSGGFANAVAGTDYLTNNQTITLSGDLSGAGSTTIATAIGVNAGNNIVTAINNAGTTGTINDNRLATISTAGKVSGSAINTGTIGGTTVINTTGTLTTGAATVSSLTIGSTAINWPANASGSLTNNGTGTLTWVPAGGSGTVTSITKGTGLVAGAPITTSGTIDVNVGTGANQIVQLDATGKLPAIDGSQLTNLPAGAETDPTVKAINGLVKSNGTTISAATAGTDYQAPLVSGTNIKTINGVSVLGVGNITAVTTETDPAVKAINGLVKSNGTTISAATAGTDYQAPITLTTTGTSGAATLVGNTLNVPNYAGTSYTAGTGLTLTTNTFSVNTSQNISTLSNLTTNGLIKTSGGTGALSIATAGTDYLTPTGNGSGLTSLNASNISSGTLPVAQVPNLDASKITTGTFTATQIPSLDAAKINTGTLPVAVGGTGANTLTGLVVGNGTSPFSAIATGTNGQILTVNAGNPTWQNAPAPSGSAGGDLLGSTYPNPVIAGGAINSAKLATSAVATSNIAPLAVTDAKINDVSPSKIAQASASSGQVLKWNGSAWAPATDNVGGGGAPTLNPGQIIVGDGTSNSAATVGLDATLNSTNGNVTVQGLRGRPIDPAVPATNSVYQFNGTQWTPVVLAGGGTVSNITVGTGLSGGPNITTTGTIGIAAGGVGTTQLANNAVTAAILSSDGSIDANRAVTTTHVRDAAITDAKLASGITVSKLSPGTNGQVLTVSGGIASWQTSGALTNPMTTPGDIIYGAAGGTPTRLATGTGFLKGGATPSYSSINLASADVTGVLPLANGGTGAATPAAARTNLGLGILSTLSAVASTEITDGTIADADISGTAAIAGSKVVPAFGAQNITTTTGSGSIGGGLNVGLANGFTINNSGNITKINGATTSFPATNAVGVLTNDGAGSLTWAPAGGGSVTTVSVVGANGFNGSVANATSTPAITIGTSVTGLLKGNGTAISAAVAGTDYLTPTGSAAALTAFPTFNQNTTGSAASLTTGRTIALTGDVTYTSGLFNGTSNVTGAATVTRINGTSLASLTTGILKNTTGTGIPSIATGADLPVMTATVGGAVPTPPNNTTTFLRGDGTFAVPAGGGTVSTVSVVSANGFNGSVATATSTPAITIGTSLTGLLKGNGTALSAATAGTDYQAPITLTTTGTSGAATLVGNTLNVPNYAGTSYTAGTGLTLTTNTFSVNTSQNISTLSNLTTNGLIKTSGGTGALSIATAGTDYLTPTGNGSGLTSLNASNISSGTLPVAQVPNLDASKITTGTFGSAQITDGTIADADVSASAAIAGSKINPNFGTQAISTTGTLTTGTAGAFGIDATGNITKIRNVTTSFPAANAAGVLTNDGTGTLTWAGGSGWGLTGNTLTGTERIGSDNAQPLAFETTNTERMRIDATGNVGIGNNAPRSSLEINNATNSFDLLRLISGSDNVGLTGIVFGRYTLAERNAKTGIFMHQKIAGDWRRGDLVFALNAGADMNEVSLADERMRITYGGNVGIANTNPTEKLDITGNLKFSGALMPNNTAGTAGQVLTSAGAGAAPTWANASSGWGLTGNSGTTPASQFIGTTDAQDFRLRTNNLERLSINSAGNVGIGTTTPISKLNVSLGQWDLVNSEGDFSIGDGTHRLKMGVSGGGGGAGDAYIASQGGTNRLFLGNSNSLANSQTLTLAGGNVGIANTNPTEKLDITGNLKFSGALMPNNTAGTAGQVLTSAGAGLPPTWSPAGSSGWGLTGNAGTNPATNFIGTTDYIPLNFRVNNQKAGQIDHANLNTFFGYQAGSVNTTGTANTAIGYQALEANTGGFGNSAYGRGALLTNNGGSGNTASGFFALASNQTGVGNTANGYYALNTNTTGSHNTAIGDGADVSSDNLFNATAIGFNAKVAASNSLVLGGTGPNSVFVGIGTTAPAVPLDIGTSLPFFISFSTYFDGSTGNGPLQLGSNSGGTVSVRASGAFLSTGFGSNGGFYVTSDERIKRKVGASNSSNDLSTLMKLRVIDYKYIDSLNYKNTPVKGVFAQEVEKVYPQAISKQTNWIPNIYALANHVEFDDAKQTLRVTMAKSHNLAVGDKVKLISSAGGEKPSVVSAVDGNSFTVSNWTEKSEKIFVYGKEVNDFRIVDYDRLFTLNLSATQELVKMLDEQKKMIDELKAKEEESKKKIAVLEASLSKVAAGETELTNLKSEIEKIKAALGMSVEATVKKAEEKTEVKKEK